MDLNKLLEKTKNKVAPEHSARQAAHIAKDDRPYELANNTQDKLETNPRQTQDKLETNLRHSEIGNNKPKTQPKTQPKTNLRQTQDKLETKYAFSSLVGIQSKIIIMVYNECKFSRNRITNPLSIEYIAEYCECPVKSIRKTIQRLEKKGVLIRSNYKNGRGGWTQYELPDETFADILQREPSDKLETNLRQTQDKLESQPKTQLETSDPRRRSLNKNSSSESQENLWITIDFLSLPLTPHKLNQIRDCGLLTAEQFQTSVNNYDRYLKTNPRSSKIKSPIDYFMSLSKKGHIFEDPDYESEEDKKIREHINKLEEKKEQREMQNKRLYELEKEEWLSTLTPEDKRALYPPISHNKGDDNPFNKSALDEYFKNNIWSKK